MKAIPILFCVFLLALNVQAQENSFALYGGYSFTTGSAAGSPPTGWKINGVYDFVPSGSDWTFGGSVGYIHLKGSQSGVLASGSYKIQAFPICLIPKFTFGSETFKGYLKGLVGMHITTVTYSGTVVGSDDTHTGISFGLGAGASYFLNDRLFLSVDYEWLRLSNAFEDSGSINSVSAGVGMKF